jgi:hypothetical protein
MFALVGIGFQEILALVFLLGIGVFVSGLPAYQAYRRGYNGFVWCLAGLLAQNPVFVLVVLAMVPHRSRQQLREQFAQELDTKLAGRNGRAAGAAQSRSVHDRSIGDAATEMPGRIDTRSLGDQVTEIPGRSIGNDQTQL